MQNRTGIIVEAPDIPDEQSLPAFNHYPAWLVDLQLMLVRSRDMSTVSCHQGASVVHNRIDGFQRQIIAGGNDEIRLSKVSLED